MKGFLVAALVSLLYAACVLLVFRWRRPERRAAFMLNLYFGSLPVLVTLLACTPADFWFLPEKLVERNALLDWAFSLFAFSASVFGGWLQLYNLADRGLSLRILIDALETPGGKVDVKSVEEKYGAGKGIQWMYSKRLADIERLGLVTRTGSDFVLSPKGARNARLVGRLRALYSLALTRELG
jgi:hypothetical protein